MPRVTHLMFVLTVWCGCSAYYADEIDPASEPKDAGDRPRAQGADWLRACDARADAGCTVRSDLWDAGPRDAGCAPGAACSFEDAAVSERDSCPDDPRKLAPGVCGCGVLDDDLDGDGTVDCVDSCPEDAEKTQPGVCGCGRSDTDRDGDGAVDCQDACPDDAAKTKPLRCGCGVRDDSMNCVDSCPDDPDKVSPGVCGCGAVDPADLAAGVIYCAKPHLRHRYNFDGVGLATRANDSVGGATAMISGIARYDTMFLVLNGDMGPGYENEGYVSLPPETLDGLRSATFETWVVWEGASATGATVGQRVFDFGGDPAGGVQLYLTVDGDPGVRAVYASAGTRVEVRAPSPQRGDLVHYAVVVDEDARRMTLYVDGESHGGADIPGGLSALAAMNRWLARSNTPSDPEFRGSLCEFRIYDTALDSAQLRASFGAGLNYNFRP